MQFIDIAGSSGVENDYSWPYAVIGVGSKGQVWAKQCHLVQEKMPVFELAQLRTLVPDNTGIIFLFVDPESIEMREHAQTIEREVERLGATTFFFVLDAECSSIFTNTTGLITTIPVTDVTLDGVPLAVRFACEIARMSAEPELCCVDVVDISCIMRGTNRGVLLLGQSNSEVKCRYTVVEQALRALPQGEFERVEGILVCLVGPDPSLQDFVNGYRAIDDVFEYEINCVVGLNPCERLSIDPICAFVLIVGCAHS